MPVALLNNVAIQTNYVDALTVHFPRGRTGFSVNVSNAAIRYTLLYIPERGQQRDPIAMPDEHELVPSFTTFNDAQQEGIPVGHIFGGIMLRSSVATSPGRVTVI